jgi:hypothetical protein
MLVQRDLEIIDFISTFKAVSSKHIQQVFKISPTVANRRLREVIKTNEIKRIRDNFTMNYLYYVEKPTKHKLIVADFYSQLINQCEIIKFEREFKVDNIQPDVFCECKKNGYRYLMFVEVQLSNVEVNIQKYEDCFSSGQWKNIFSIFPRIIVISDKRYNIYSKLTIIQIDSEFKEINKIFCI